jgi:hypothetical protein
MEFVKATVQEVSSAPSPNPQPVGTAIAVQVNPASLRLQLQNNVDAGKAFARPNTQYQGSSSSTLSFDLLFDTADEGTTDDPVDVRTRTRQLERFLLPSKDSPKAVPPRVQFTYGTLAVVGVMTAMNQDFDFFAPNGVPLRAKCAVTIKEQKPEFDAKLTGAGANTGAGATPPVPPGAGGGAPGTEPAGGGGGAPAPADRTGTALGGESAADFASRMGLDPRAWKDIAGALSNPLSLEAGLQVDFSASLSLDVGLGLEVGATAGVSVGGGGPGGGGSGGGAPATPVAAQPPASGTALTAAGGLARALDRDTAARTAQAADAARVSFGAPLQRIASGVPSSPAAGGPTSPSSPAAGGGAVAAVAAVAGPGSGLAGPPGPSPAAATVTADPRAASYGFGVPLRERRAVAQRAAPGLVHVMARAVSFGPTDGAPETDDPTVPGWEALPAGPVLVGAAAGADAGLAGSGGCGCGCGTGGCGCGCGCGGGAG